MRPAFYKRKYFIKKELQGRIIFNYFILLAIGTVLFSLVFSFFSSNTLSIVYDDYRLQLGTTPGILLNKMLSTQWIFIVIGGLGVVVFTMLLTHKIAGPFFRFEKTLDGMANKDLSSKIFLRKGDEGGELGQKINTFNVMLSQELKTLKEHAEQIDQICSTDGDIEQAQLKEIKRLANDSLSIINSFKLMAG